MYKDSSNYVLRGRIRQEGWLGLIYREVPSRGVTYVYSNDAYYDSEKKQTRSKRKLIGKLDPESGEIIPTGKQGRRKRPAAGAGRPEAEGMTETEIKERLEEQEREIELLKNRVGILEKDNEKLRADRDKARAALKEQRRELAEVVEGAASVTRRMREILSLR